jgi:hypothetical protein
MPDYPPSSRRKRRYPVEWQKDDYVCTGFTQDISPTGIFVRSTYIPEFGLTVSLKLLLPEGQKLRVRGTVVRSYCVPANLRRFIPSGFGVRLNEAPEEYFQLLARLFGLRFRGKRDARSVEDVPKLAS